MSHRLAKLFIKLQVYITYILLPLPLPGKGRRLKIDAWGKNEKEEVKNKEEQGRREDVEGKKMKNKDKQG